MKDIDKLLLLSFLIKNADDLVESESLNREYKNIIDAGNLIVVFQDKLRIYELSGSAEEEMQHIVDTIQNRPDRFIEGVYMMEEFLNSIKNYSESTRLELRNGILPHSKNVSAMDKTLADAYSEFYDELYMHYCYYHMCMYGRQFINELKKFLGKKCIEIMEFLDENLYVDLKKNQRNLNNSWCIYEIQYQNIKSYELMYVKNDLFNKGEMLFEGGEQYARWLWGNGKTSKLMYQNKSIAYWGAGNICNFSYKDIDNVLSGKILYELGSEKHISMICFNPIDTISKYLGEGVYFCISPEDLVALMNRYEMNQVAKKRADEKLCLVCGRAVVPNHRFCDKHYRFT